MKALRLFLVIALMNPLIASAHELAHAMETMSDQLRIVADVLVKNKTIPEAELLAASDALVKATFEASKILPETFNTPEGPKALGPAEVAHYNDLMTKLLVALTEIDQNLKAGNKAVAKEILATKVAELKKDGHKFFK